MRGSRLLRRTADWLRAHAAADRHSVTITIAPSQAERTFQIDLPRWSLRLLGATFAVSFLLILAGGILYGKLIRDALILREVRKENEVLRARSVRLNEIEADMAQLERVRRQLLALAGVPVAEASEQDQATTRGSLQVGAGETERPGQEALSVAATETPLRVLPFRGPISRGYTASSGRNPEHRGIDVAGQEGTPVAAAGDGVVVFAGRDSTFGNLLVLRHANGWETRYGHNQALVVAPGDSIRAGQTIGLLGSTGRSSAPHLHFEVLRDGRSQDPGELFPAYRTRF